MYTSDDEAWVFVGKKPLTSQDKKVIKQLNEYYAHLPPVKKPLKSKDVSLSPRKNRHKFQK